MEKWLYFTVGISARVAIFILGVCVGIIATEVYAAIRYTTNGEDE